MIASSPIYFARHLPTTQVHLAAKDRIVPLSQGDELQQVIDTLQSPPPFDMFVYDQRTHEDIANDNTEMDNRIEQLLSKL